MIAMSDASWVVLVSFLIAGLIAFALFNRDPGPGSMSESWMEDQRRKAGR